MSLNNQDDEARDAVVDHLETAPVEPMRNDEMHVAHAEPQKDDQEEYSDCWYISMACLCLVIGVVIIVVMLVVVKDDDDGGIEPTMPPTPAPTEPFAMVADPQERLNILLSAVEKNPATAGMYQIPAVAFELKTAAASGSSSSDPVVRAADWVVHQDTYHVEREIVQRFALANIYYSTGGDDWINKEGWFGDSSYCNGWEGLTCCRSFYAELDPHQCVDKEDHHLIVCDLAENNLKGEIPAAFALLEHIEVLWLEGNILTGPLDPVVFGNMPALDALYVHRNSLSGGINGTIRSNGKLDTLFAHGNDFTGDWPIEFCPFCREAGVCESIPVAYTLDCRQMDCPALCCISNEVRNHCYKETEDVGGDGLRLLKEKV